MTTASGREPEGLAALVDPASTAVLTMEMQRGVVGPDAMMKTLVERVSAAGTVRAAAAVCDAARGVGARVVHCVVHTREEGAAISLG